MSTYAARPRPGTRLSADHALQGLRRLVAGRSLPRGAVFGLIIVGGMLGFEIFNYSTTQFALSDLLGTQRFAGLSWATILALAFCAIDFAGIARLFSPQRGRQEPAEVWYLLGAWFLAATMNALLTWWGVSLALLSHSGLGNEILGRQALLDGVPVFVAVLVWLIRVLMIGTLTLGGNRPISERPASAPAPVRRTPAGAHVLGGDTPQPSTPVARPIHAAPKPSGAHLPGYESQRLSARPPTRQ